MENLKIVKCDSCYNCGYSKIINKGHIIECNYNNKKITICDKRPQKCDFWEKENK